MARANPGPFEPLIYLIQTPVSFRVVGIGGFALFTICFLAIAARHGAGYAAAGVALLAGFWLESSATVCRRCRFYGTWHCAGQGMIVSRIFSLAAPGVSDMRIILHAATGAALIIYGLFWIWHSPILGLIFTVWLPFAVISAFPPGGFSWRKPSAESKAA